MPQYMVTMNLTRADPLLNIGRLTDIVRGAILPSLERLKDLQSEGKSWPEGIRSGSATSCCSWRRSPRMSCTRCWGDCPFRSWGTRP
jgi:hypothetical protein